MRSCRALGRPRSEAADRAIVAATLELLAAEGYGSLSMADVALRAGVGKATIYRRFPGKAELVAEALGSLNDDLPEITRRPVLRDTLVELLESIRTRSPHSLISRIQARMVGEAQAHPDLVRSFHDRVLRERRDRFRAVLESGIATGQLPVDTDVGLVTTLLVAPVLHQAMWHGCGAEGGDRSSSERIVDVVLAGVRHGTAALAHPAGADRAGADRAGEDRAGGDRAGEDRAGGDQAGGDQREATLTASST